MTTALPEGRGDDASSPLFLSTASHAAGPLSGGALAAVAGIPIESEPMSSVGDWIVLLKPRVLTLVVFTGWIGLLVAPGHLNGVLALAAVLSITVAAGAAGVINMWWDRDIDAIMRRTSKRPIPAGRIAPGEALGFGVTLAVGSVIVMGLATNIAAAAILALSIGFYVVIYTMWLKRRTPQNIVIGGAAGAFPPMIGWAAVTGNVDAMSLLMFAIIFFWTPPHFWALALFASGDYERAGVPMLPVVAGARETRRQILLYTVVLAVVSVLPWALGYTGAIYGLSAIVLGIGFLVGAWRVWRDAQDATGVSLTRDAPARAAFKYSIVYLFVLFGALAVDRLVASAMQPEIEVLPSLSREASDAIARRRRGRNLAMLVVLIAVAALFYAIAIVKFAHPDLTPHPGGM